MNIDQMAHEMALSMQSAEPITDMNLVAALCYQYADAMQAEADKRKPKGLPEVLFEPDWSVAPDWASWWAVDMNGDSHWYSFEPVKNLEINEWTLQNNGEGADNVFDADSSSIYKVDWKDSLRKRP